MRQANQELQQLLNTDSVLNSSQKRYIERLSQKAESYKARVVMLEKRVQDATDVLSSRKRVDTGVRQYLRGKHVMTAGDVYDKVSNHEQIIEEQKNKKQKKTATQSAEEVQSQVEDTSTIEIYDRAVVE